VSAGKDQKTALELLRKVRALPSASPYVGSKHVIVTDRGADIALARLSSEFACVFPLRALCIEVALSAATLARLLQAMVQCRTLRSLSLGEVPEETVAQCLEALADSNCTVRCLEVTLNQALYDPLYNLLQKRQNWSSLRLRETDWTSTEWEAVCYVLEQNRTALLLDVETSDCDLEDIWQFLGGVKNLTSLRCQSRIDKADLCLSKLWLPGLASVVNLHSFLFTLPPRPHSLCHLNCCCWMPACRI
jgi:hypothetical protein